MRKASELGGCRYPFDTWASTSLPMCNYTTGQEYYDMVYNLTNSEPRVIINKTGCLIPCKYREYKVVGNPFHVPACQSMNWSGCDPGYS